jgi:hypothetical protein
MAVTNGSDKPEGLWTPQEIAGKFGEITE